MITDFTLHMHTLSTCMANVGAVELKGMALLKDVSHPQRRPRGQFFPQFEGAEHGIPREVIAEAVTEIVGYTERCRRAAQQLAKLAPIPLTAFSILEFGL